MGHRNNANDAGAKYGTPICIGAIYGIITTFFQKTELTNTTQQSSVCLQKDKKKVDQRNT